MNIQINTNNFTLSADLESAITTALEKLTRLYDPLAVHVYLEQNTHHRKGDIYSIEVDFHVPRKILRARIKRLQDIRAGLVEIEQKLKRQIVKYKEKRQQS